MIAEASEKLKNNILALSRDRRLHALAVTSSLGKEGWSAVAVNLARALARQPDTRVLLVDANLRRPALARILGVAADGPGLAALAGGEADPDSVIVPVSDNLYWIPSGKVTGPPALVFESGFLARLLAAAEDRFQYIIIDAPPVTTAPETLALAAAADGVLLTIHAGHTRREVVQEAVGQLHLAGADVLGVVLARRKYTIPEFIYKRL